MIVNTIDKTIEEHGLTAYRVAKDLGLTPRFFTRLKKPNAMANGTNISKLCDYFNCQPGDFIKYVPDEKTN